MRRIKSIFRVYFFRNGEELTGHPLNGREWSGSGSRIGNIGSWLCRRDIWVMIGNKECMVTSECFDGPVTVKVWNGPEDSEWSCLCERSDIEARGGEVESADWASEKYDRNPTEQHPLATDYIAQLNSK